MGINDLVDSIVLTLNLLPNKHALLVLE